MSETNKRPQARTSLLCQREQEGLIEVDCDRRLEVQYKKLDTLYPLLYLSVRLLMCCLGQGHRVIENVPHALAHCA